MPDAEVVGRGVGRQAAVDEQHVAPADGLGEVGEPGEDAGGRLVEAAKEGRHLVLRAVEAPRRERRPAAVPEPDVDDVDGRPTRPGGAGARGCRAPARRHRPPPRPRSRAGGATRRAGGSRGRGPRSRRSRPARSRAARPSGARRRPAPPGGARPRTRSRPRADRRTPRRSSRRARGGCGARARGAGRWDGGWSRGHSCRPRATGAGPRPGCGRSSRGSPPGMVDDAIPAVERHRRA